MIIKSGTVNGTDMYDALDLPADWEGSGMPEEWLDNADPIALVIAAILDTPGVPAAAVQAIGRTLVAILAAYARGDVTVDW